MVTLTMMQTEYGFTTKNVLEGEFKDMRIALKSISIPIPKLYLYHNDHLNSLVGFAWAGKFLELSLILHHQMCQMLWWIW